MSKLIRSPPGRSMQHTLSDSDVSSIVPTPATPSYISKRNKRQRESSDEQLSSFKDEIRNMLDEWKNTQKSLINKLVSDIAEIKQQNIQIQRSNKEIEKALDFLNNQYEDMKKKEPTNKDVFRLNSKTGKTTIVTEFTSVIVKNSVIQAAKTFNKQHPDQRLNSAMIGFKEQVRPIYVSEALTNKGRRLFFLARSYAKTEGYKFCWTSHGKVYLRKTAESPHIEVKDETQLLDLKKQN
ncbi:unnamed protein product [Parnassius mnemosyne]|uniref:FP protein C-terminal domain-containing protein n=1 Tax=Parnassius mnemosyne TaxID=213953 RepID=A0AAV1LWG5_9NEOP